MTPEEIKKLSNENLIEFSFQQAYLIGLPETNKEATKCFLDVYRKELLRRMKACIENSRNYSEEFSHGMHHE